MAQDLLQDGVNVFLSYDWEIKHHMGNSVQLEKESLGMSPWVAGTAAFIFGLLGAYFVNKRRDANKQTISLSLTEDGQLQVAGRKVAMKTSSPQQLITFADVESGISAGTIWGIALISTMFWCAFSIATSS
jgi:hypothetical protein